MINTPIRFTTRLLLLSFISCSSLAARAQQSTTINRFYVSPTGNDSNRGSQKQPFATAQAALQTAQKMKSGNSGNAIEIVFTAGVHYLDKPITLTASHSGSPNQPLRLKAEEGGGNVTLSGAKLLNLKWTNNGAGVWQAKVTDGTSFQGLFAGDKRLIRARYPNYDASILPFQGYAADALSPERVASWKNPTGGIVHALHAGRWGGFHYLITGKDDNNQLILTGGDQNNRPSAMHETYRYVENIREELDSEQEWYLDEETSTLYYMPAKGIDPNSLTFEAPQLENLIHITGSSSQPVHDIEISGLRLVRTAETFMKTAEPLLRSDWTIYRQGAIKIEGAANCIIKANDLFDLGGNAIFMSNYNRNVTISGNEIARIGAGAINFVGDPAAVRSPSFRYEKFVPFSEMDTLKGPKTENYPMSCEASDNLIHDIGLIEKQVAGVQIAMASTLRILHNIIYDVPRAGINIGDGTWGGHEIAYNDVFNTVLETSDHGAFNSWGRDRFWHPDRRTMDQLTAEHPELILLDAVETTKIHDNRFRCDHGWDIDLDDGSSNYEIYNNLCLSGGLKLREGFYRNVYNNVMVNNGFHPHVWFRNSHDVFRDNLLMQSHQDIQVQYWGDMVDHNIYSNAADLAKDQAKGVETNGKVVEFKFVDAKNGDFRLLDWKDEGFKNIDMDQFGVSSSRLKAVAKTPDIPAIIGALDSKQGEIWEWNGATFKTIETLGEQSATGLPSIAGVLIVKISDDSKLYKSGLRNGDVLLDYDGIPTLKLTDFQQAIRKLVHVDQPTLTIFRNQQTEKLKIQR